MLHRYARVKQKIVNQMKAVGLGLYENKMDGTGVMDVREQLLPFIKHNSRYFVLACGCVIAETVFELVIPVLMADIIDVGIANGDRAYILMRGGWMIGCALISLILGILYARYAAQAGQRFGAELRAALFDHVQSFSFTNMDHFTTASLITRLTGDITILQNAIANGIRPLFRSPVMMLTALVLTFSINPRLACVFCVSIPLLAIGLSMIVLKVGPLYRRMQGSMDRVNTVVQENIQAIRFVKAYVCGEREIDKFAQVNDDLQAVSLDAFRISVWNMPLFQLISYGTMIALLWFGGNMIFAGTMSVGELTGFLSYVLQILNGLMMLSNVFLMLTRSIASADRICEVLEEKNDMIEADNALQPIRNGEVVFHHVHFRYRPDAPEILHDIDLTIPAGSSLGVLGGTGAAKTSLVQLIPRLYDVSEGAVTVDGYDVRGCELGHLRDSIAMVLQKNTLFSGTIRENLLWGNEQADDEEIYRVCRLACVDEFLDSFPAGLYTMLEQGGVNLSGGQRQRLCIARALLKKPKILILDDSTSAVDTATEAKIKQGLAQLSTMTKIIIAQRVSSVMDLDQIAILEEGELQAHGTHEELLMTDQIYQEIYRSQQEGANL